MTTPELTSSNLFRRADDDLYARVSVLEAQMRFGAEQSRDNHMALIEISNKFEAFGREMAESRQVISENTIALRSAANAIDGMSADTEANKIDIERFKTVMHTLARVCSIGIIVIGAAWTVFVFFAK